ncbi:MAG: TlpA disulfide reductase family protein [Bergeyella sp.]
MKKFALPLFIILFLAGCKKEAVITENTPETDSTEAVENENSAPKEIFTAVEFSPEQASEFLNHQKNDTLYVTNFFATWCGPCVREIPRFKEKMEDLKGQPVKFTFISLDQKSDWDVKVKNFVEEHGIAKQTVLLDGEFLTPQFFADNFKTWKGEFIPFTYLKKGDKSEEINGSISKEELESRLSNFTFSPEKQNHKEQVPENSNPSEKKIKSSGKKIKLDDDYTVGTINQPIHM